MKKDNVILANFEFLVDLDLAMYRFIKDKFSNSKYVDQEFINEPNEDKVIYKLLNRIHINPLEIIMPEADTTSLYYELLDENYEELLSYATAYDTFPLLITLLNNASSLDIVVRCKNKLEKEFINNLNPRINAKIIPTRHEIDLKDYTVIYEKYFANLIEYNNLAVKHIYIAAAKFNMEPDRDMINGSLAILFGDVNIIHLMDLYRYVKFRFKKTEEDATDEDLL
jgi:hypothetical protein